MRRRIVAIADEYGWHPSFAVRSTFAPIEHRWQIIAVRDTPKAMQILDGQIGHLHVESVDPRRGEDRPLLKELERGGEELQGLDVVGAEACRDREIDIEIQRRLALDFYER